MTALDMLTVPWPTDTVGPRSVTLLRLPTGCLGIVVVDDVRLGTAIGGVRLGASVTPVEVMRLARAMTLKNAAAGLPHGGGKAGIRTPQDWDPANREAVIRAFAVGIRHLDEYTPGPDMGTDETAMAWIQDEIGRAVGLPAILGGIPLDELGATGFGLGVCAKALADAGRLRLSGARVAIQGFGAVGRNAAIALRKHGAVLVATCDRTGGVYDPDGLDIDDLAAFSREQPLAYYSGAKPIDRDDVLTTDCDILVPAAQPDVLHEDNVDKVRASVVLSGANIPATAAAEASLHARGVLVVPDFVANAGGVICAAVELDGGDRVRAFAEIEEKIRANTLELLDRMASTGLPPRAAAEGMAADRLGSADAFRRRF